MNTENLMSLSLSTSLKIHPLPLIRQAFCEDEHKGHLRL